MQWRRHCRSYQHEKFTVQNSAGSTSGLGDYNNASAPSLWMTRWCILVGHLDHRMLDLKKATACSLVWPQWPKLDPAFKSFGISIAAATILLSRQRPKTMIDGPAGIITTTRPPRTKATGIDHKKNDDGLGLSFHVDTSWKINVCLFCCFLAGQPSLEKTATLLYQCLQA